MRRLWVRPFDYGRRLRRIVAVCGQYPVKNCRVGSCISVAFQFLGFQNRDGSFEFCWGLRLFLPKAVLHLLVCPAN
jgi:hypothetical protein